MKSWRSVAGFVQWGDAVPQGRGELAGVQDGWAEHGGRIEAGGLGLCTGVGGRALGLVGAQAPGAQFGVEAPVPGGGIKAGCGIIGAAGHERVSVVAVELSRMAEKAVRKERHSARRAASSVRPAAVSS